MKTYTARLCWNSKGWRYPTGEAAKEGGSSTFVNDAGFGHEEWLLDCSRQIDGWHYAFIQGVNASRHSERSLAGKAVRIVLFTVSPKGEHLRIGCLRQCTVLTDDECDGAFDAYTKRGWIGEMAQEADKIGGKGGLIRKPEKTCWVFNIRFRKEDFEPFVPYEIISKSDWQYRRSYYVLQEPPASTTEKWGKPPSGTRDPLKTDPIRKPSQSGATYDPVQRRLQNFLLKILEKRYGKTVLLEKSWVDVAIDHADMFAYIEVKSNPNARLAIREALGQILEYACFPNGPGERAPRLFVAAPGKRTDDVDTYLAFLRKRFRLDVGYVEVGLDTNPEDILEAISEGES